MGRDFLAAFFSKLVIRQAVKRDKDLPERIRLCIAANRFNQSLTDTMKKGEVEITCRTPQVGFRYTWLNKQALSRCFNKLETKQRLSPFGRLRKRN